MVHCPDRRSSLKLAEVLILSATHTGGAPVKVFQVEPYHSRLRGTHDPFVVPTDSKAFTFMANMHLPVHLNSSDLVLPKSLSSNRVVVGSVSIPFDHRALLTPLLPVSCPFPQGDLQPSVADVSYLKLSRGQTPRFFKEIKQ
jgi:hypothetical protein